MTIHIKAIKRQYFGVNQNSVVYYAVQLQGGSTFFLKRDHLNANLLGTQHYFSAMLVFAPYLAGLTLNTLIMFF